MLQATHEFAVQVTTEVERALSQTLPASLSKDAFVLGLLAGRFLNCLKLKETPTKEVYTELFFGRDWLEDSLTTLLMRRERTHLNYDRAARTCEFYAGLFPEHLERQGTILDAEHYLKALAASYYAMGEHLPEFRRISNDVDAVIEGFQVVSATFPWREIGVQKYQLN